MNSIDKSDFLLRLKGAEKAFLVNDDHCYFYDLSATGYLRLAIVKTADFFVSKGIIENKKDIFFLNLDEIKRYLMMLHNNTVEYATYELINKRKLDYQDQKSIMPPAYIGKAPLTSALIASTVPCEKITIIKGISGLKKKVSGRVKVITDNDKIELNEETILVMKHGHLCYLLPYINKIKGLIFDAGSPYDHPGIIARELLIPSMYNTQIATKILKDGDEVELDGINECVILKKV
jgi:pyruvate,water dikinase